MTLSNKLAFITNILFVSAVSFRHCCHKLLPCPQIAEEKEFGNDKMQLIVLER